MNSNAIRVHSPFQSRSYQHEDDFIQMRRMLMEAHAQTEDWRYAHPGEMQFDFFMVTCHLDLRRHIRLWHDGNRLVAYAMLGEDPAFNVQVLPGYEWQGIEEEAIEWAEALAGELKAQDAETWGGQMVSGSRQDNAERIAFLERHGFRPGGQFSEVNTIRSLAEPIAETVLPDGWQVRSMADLGEGAISKRARAIREVWQPWTVGNVSDTDYAVFMRMPGYRADLDVVTIAQDGAIAAYVNGWLDPVNGIGDFGPVGCREEYRRMGLTRAVLLESLRRMRDCGMDRVCVSTGETNTAALRLYESVGFHVVNRYVEYLRI